MPNFEDGCRMDKYYFDKELWNHMMQGGAYADFKNTTGEYCPLWRLVDIHALINQAAKRLAEQSALPEREHP